MGTRGGGVARFDGQEFETFTTKDSLAGNYINAITSGGNMVWVATNSGVSFYKNKKWSSVLKGKVVQDIELINGTLWLIAEGELFTTNKTLDKLYKYLSIKGSLKKLEKGFKNQVWVCSQTKVYHIMPDSVASYRLDKSIECIEYQHPNELWVATHGQGLYQLNGQEWIEFGHLMEIEDEIIYNVFKDGSVLWINTLTKGVFQFNTSDSSFVNFREVNGLSNNHTRVTQKDSWGNIWIVVKLL
jgi:ligand-binding sensor domain-containing protein